MAVIPLGNIPDRSHNTGINAIIPKKGIQSLLSPLARAHKHGSHTLWVEGPSRSDKMSRCRGDLFDAVGSERDVGCACLAVELQTSAKSKACCK